MVYVNLGENSYNVHVDGDLLSQVGRVVKQFGITKALVVTDSNVAPLYLDQVMCSLCEEGIKSDSLILPAGEIFKTVASVELIWEKALDARLDRESLFIALGGGVIGDLTGFSAATFLRGIPFLQLPTTVLSQVDASVGGKTGCNLRKGKNLVGAFYQPISVLADTKTLLSLSEREYINGFAEIVKHALINSSDLFCVLENNLDKIKRRDLDLLKDIVIKNIKIKASVVQTDEKEKGKRALLNLGHTAGHALEELGNYKIYYHGEAIAIGLVLACHIAWQKRLFSKENLDRIKYLLTKLGLPTSPKEKIDPSIWWEKTYSDKKLLDDTVYWVLPNGFGEALIGQRVEFAEFVAAVESL